MIPPSLKKSPRIRIIGAASGIGAQDQACKDGPMAFHRSQAWHELEHHSQVDWGRTLFAPDDDGEPVVARISELCRHLADEVALTLQADEFPVVIGGDHSVAIGTWSGVARVLGKPLEIVIYDSGSDAAKAKQFATRLVEEDKVIGQVGVTWRDSMGQYHSGTTGGTRVEQEVVTRSEACKAIESRASRPGRQLDEVPSSYEKLKGKDLC